MGSGFGARSRAHVHNGRADGLERHRARPPRHTVSASTRAPSSDRRPSFLVVVPRPQPPCPRHGTPAPRCRDRTRAARIAAADRHDGLGVSPGIAAEDAGAEDPCRAHPATMLCRDLRTLCHPLACEKERRGRGSMGEGKGDILRADLLQHYQPSWYARGSWPVRQPAGGCERPVGQPSSWELLARHAGKVHPGTGGHVESSAGGGKVVL